MKYLYYLTGLLIVMTVASCSSTRYYQDNPEAYNQDYDQQQMITYQQFYNDLSPYGDWIDYGNYGYGWIPYQQNFRPYYTNGYWAYTNYGWTWVSNYNWGWAPFHYGRWIHDFRYGWVWIPGYQWAPAWVAWRGGGDYYGWAPLGPGMDFDMNAGSIPYNDWTFVPGRYMNSPRAYKYYVQPDRNSYIINNTRLINNKVVTRSVNGTRNLDYNAGPPVREVEQTTGAPVRRLNVQTSNNPEPTRVAGSTIRVFRPSVNQAPSNGNPRPQKIRSTEEQKNNPPVREFPKDQTPQVLKNEPPVRNNQPALTPENRNNPPARVFPRAKENQPAENKPVEPSRSVPSNDQQKENKPVNPAPVRRFPANPTPSVNNKPAEQPARNDARPNVQPQNNEKRNDQPVRTLSNDRPAASNVRPAVRPNEFKQNENKISSRPAETPQEMSKMNNQQMKPAPQPRVQNNAPVRQPVRTITRNPQPAPQNNGQEKKDQENQTTRSIRH
ncbi:MAG: DUF6600 domain-containing protein [Ginsengibacter sp.]